MTQLSEKKRLGRPPIKTPGMLLIKPEHHIFLVQCVARFITSPTELSKYLASKKWGKTCEFKPIQVLPRDVIHYCRLIPNAEIAEVRNKYLTDFSETPLAFKVERLKELTKLYRQVDGLTRLVRRRVASGEEHGSMAFEDSELDLGQVQKLEKKLVILRQIKDEMGEDAEKLASAIREARVPILNIVFTPELAREVGGALIALSQIEAEQSKEVDADFTVEGVEE